MGWEYCEKCEKERPPRSHHCSKCARCSRKMDHHCIWVNNCIGEDNLGIFIRFISYAWLQSSSTGFCCLLYYTNWFPPCSSCLIVQPDDLQKVKIQMFCLTLILSWLVVFLSGMLIERSLLLAAEMTTIEMMANRSLLKARIRDPQNPGLITTTNRAFGTPIFFLWFIPWCCESRITPEYERTIQTFWSYYQV